MAVLGTGLPVWGVALLAGVLAVTIGWSAHVGSGSPSAPEL
jgi:hypothetical protein